MTLIRLQEENRTDTMRRILVEAESYERLMAAMTAFHATRAAGAPQPSIEEIVAGILSFAGHGVTCVRRETLFSRDVTPEWKLNDGPSGEPAYMKINAATGFFEETCHYSRGERCNDARRPVPDPLPDVMRAEPGRKFYDECGRLRRLLFYSSGKLQNEGYYGYAAAEIDVDGHIIRVARYDQDKLNDLVIRDDSVGTLVTYPAIEMRDARGEVIAAQRAKDGVPGARLLDIEIYGLNAYRHAMAREAALQKAACLSHPNRSKLRVLKP